MRCCASGSLRTGTSSPRSCCAGGDHAEQLIRLRPRSVDAQLLQHRPRRPCERDGHDYSPHRPDGRLRRIRPARDQRRRPRPGRDEHLRAATSRPGSRRTPTAVSPRVTMCAGAPISIVAPARRARRRTPSSPLPARPDSPSPAGTRRDPVRVPARKRAAPRGRAPWRKLGRMSRDGSGSGSDRGRVVAEQQQARRLQVPASKSVPSSARDRAPAIVVEVGQVRVERVLDGTRVAARRCAGDLVALEQATRATGLGQERRRRHADDPAADDGDVKRLSRHDTP